MLLDWVKKEDSAELKIAGIFVWRAGSSALLE